VSRLVVLIGIAASCGRGSATPPPGSQHDPANAPASFVVLCAPCHGVDARGYKADHAPSLVTSTFLESASDDFLRRSIVFGRPGTSMAAYGKEAGGKLDDAQVGELVTWLRAQGPAYRAPPAGQPGSIQRGSASYERACMRCHGTRTARGDAVHLANLRFLDAASDPFLRWAIVHGRPDTKMEAWQGKLSDNDIDDLVAYVRAFAAPVEVHLLPPPTGKEPLVIHPQGKDPQFEVRRDSERAYVPIDQVAKALADGRKLIVIDARPQSEWRTVHVEGAVSMPYDELKKLDAIPKDGTWVLAYCACPHHLSGIVIDELQKRGYKRVAVLDEGILAWHRHGYPVVAAPGVEPPPAEGLPH
jgi:rhodanese-related sulfurtransferase/mono/diheme cytochrome c family protein